MRVGGGYRPGLWVLLLELSYHGLVGRQRRQGPDLGVVYVARGRSERMRRMESKLCREDEQELAHSSEPP